MLTVMSWLWSQPGGRTRFNAEHVNTWADMAERNLTMPHRLACVTDNPAGIDARIHIITPPGDFVGIESPTWVNGRPNCYRRLALFRRDAAKIFGERFVSMDLDCVIGGLLDPLFSRPEDLVLFRGTARDRPYNGSMVMMTAGARPAVFETFTAEGAAEAGAIFIGSDQSWLMHCLGPSEATWSAKDGAMWWGSDYRSLIRSRRAHKPAVLFFPGKLKPWDICHTRIDPYVFEHYRRTPASTEAAA